MACGYLSHRATPPPAQERVPASFLCSRARARGTHTCACPCVCSSPGCAALCAHGTGGRGRQAGRGACVSGWCQGPAVSGCVAVGIVCVQMSWVCVCGRRRTPPRRATCLDTACHPEPAPEAARRPFLPWPCPREPVTITDDIAVSLSSSSINEVARATPRPSVSLHGPPCQCLARGCPQAGPRHRQWAGRWSTAVFEASRQHVVAQSPEHGAGRTTICCVHRDPGARPGVRLSVTTEGPWRVDRGADEPLPCLEPQGLNVQMGQRPPPQKATLC